MCHMSYDIWHVTYDFGASVSSHVFTNLPGAGIYETLCDSVSVSSDKITFRIFFSGMMRN